METYMTYPERMQALFNTFYNWRTETPTHTEILDFEHALEKNGLRVVAIKDIPLPPPNAPKIVDVIEQARKTGNGVKHYIVLDKEPNFVFEKLHDGKVLLASDGPIYKAYFYRKQSKNNKAFSGREFDIVTTDGIIKAKGQWWEADPGAILEGMGIPDIRLRNIGYSSIPRLKKGNLFYSGYVDVKALTEWLCRNVPTQNYWAYDGLSKSKNTPPF